MTIKKKFKKNIIVYEMCYKNKLLKNWDLFPYLLLVIISTELILNVIIT